MILSLDTYDYLIKFLIENERQIRWNIGFDEWNNRRFVEGWDFESQLKKIDVMNKKTDIMNKKTDIMIKETDIMIKEVEEMFKKNRKREIMKERKTKWYYYLIFN